jgi:hypothetical protein
MARSDDEQWWDLLAGKAAPDVPDEKSRHAKALREAVLRQHRAIEADIDAGASLARFQARLERERPAIGKGTREAGDTGPASVFGSIVRWLRGLRGPQIAVAFALLLAVGAIVRMGLQPQPDFVMRDYAVGQRNYVKVDDPQVHQARLVAELKALGIDAETLANPDVNGALVVQATVPTQSSEALLKILERHGLRGFRAGELDVGFQRR